jgi:predicted transcriptional regulator YheO
MTEQQKQEIIEELKEYIDIILQPIDNDCLFPLKYNLSKYHISQARLANDLKVSRQTVYRWLHNKQRISDRDLGRIIKYFDDLESYK